MSSDEKQTLERQAAERLAESMVITGFCWPTSIFNKS